MAEHKENICSCIDAEGLAVLKAVRWADRLSVKDCIFGTDCAEVYSMILKYSGWPLAARAWIAECAGALSINKGWRLYLVRREARKAAADCWYWSSLTAVPLFLGRLV